MPSDFPNDIEDREAAANGGAEHEAAVAATKDTSTGRRQEDYEFCRDDRPHEREMKRWARRRGARDEERGEQRDGGGHDAVTQARDATAAAAVEAFRRQPQCSHQGLCEAPAVGAGFESGERDAAVRGPQHR